MVASAHLDFHTSSQLRVMVFKQKEDTQLSTKQKFKYQNAGVIEPATTPGSVSSV